MCVWWGGHWKCRKSDTKRGQSYSHCSSLKLKRGVDTYVILLLKCFVISKLQALLFILPHGDRLQC